MIRAVLDTNVILSALLFGGRTGGPGQGVADRLISAPSLPSDP